MRLSTAKILIPCISLLLPSLSSAQCQLYQNYAAQYHEPFTQGTWNLSYARPIVPCRTYRSEEVEKTIERLRGVIKDPDLFRVCDFATAVLQRWCVDVMTDFREYMAEYFGYDDCVARMVEYD